MRSPLSLIIAEFGLICTSCASRIDALLFERHPMRFLLTQLLLGAVEHGQVHRAASSGRLSPFFSLNAASLLFELTDVRAHAIALVGEERGGVLREARALGDVLVQDTASSARSRLASPCPVERLVYDTENAIVAARGMPLRGSMTSALIMSSLMSLRMLRDQLFARVALALVGYRS